MASRLAFSSALVVRDGDAQDGHATGSVPRRAFADVSCSCLSQVRQPFPVGTPSITVIFTHLDVSSSRVTQRLMFHEASGLTAIFAQTLRSHVRRSGGELATHDAGLCAVAHSLVPDSRVRWSLRYASDDGWFTFRRGAGTAIDPKTFVLAAVLCCSSRCRMPAHFIGLHSLAWPVSGDAVSACTQVHISEAPR